MRPWILVMVLACGGGDSDSVPETPTGSPAGSTTTTSSSTTETPTTWDCNEWYPCQDCGGDHCGAEISACAGDGACGAALNAWAGCVLDCEWPRGCADTFEANGGPRAEDLLACTEQSCADACDL